MEGYLLEPPLGFYGIVMLTNKLQEEIAEAV